MLLFKDMEDFFINLVSSGSEIYQLLLSLFLGIFIGLRQEMILQKNNIKGIIGIRTISILMILGTVSTFFEESLIFSLVTFLGILIFLFIAYYNGVFKLNRIGLTSELMAILFFWVGVLIGQEKILLGITLSVILAIFISYKNPIHNFAKKFSLKEWTGSLQLLIITVIIWPLLPNKTIDPFGVFNPSDIWLLVILISFIGFLGYYFQKFFNNKKSIFLTSFFGSLISSTIITTTLSEKSKRDKNFNILLSALMLGISVMQLRIIVEILILTGLNNIKLLFPSIAMLSFSIILGLIFYSKSKEKKVECEVLQESKSPFEFLPSLKFASIFIIILFAVYFGKTYLGNLGGYIVAFLSSLVDADAIVLSSLESYKNSLISLNFLSTIILIAITINTLIKILYIFIFGDRKFFKKSVIPILLISLSGFLVWIFI